MIHPIKTNLSIKIIAHESDFANRERQDFQWIMKNWPIVFLVPCKAIRWSKDYTLILKSA